MRPKHQQTLKEGAQWLSGRELDSRPKGRGFIVSKGATIRNRYNQVPHLTQDTNWKVTNSQLDTTNDSWRHCVVVFEQDTFILA